VVATGRNGEGSSSQKSERNGVGFAHDVGG
jgi:hypothetical protein